LLAQRAQSVERAFAEGVRIQYQTWIDSRGAALRKARRRMNEPS